MIKEEMFLCLFMEVRFCGFGSLPLLDVADCTSSSQMPNHKKLTSTNSRKYQDLWLDSIRIADVQRSHTIEM